MKYVVTTEVTRDLGYINSSGRYKFGTFDSVSNKNIKQDFCLVRIEPCTLGTFRIYFKKNSEEKYYVDTLSMDLESYIMFMNDNPSFVIEINSNCSFDEKNPDSLSKKRAEYLKNILIKKGINKDRVVIKALGIKHPSVTKDQINKFQSLKEKEEANRSNRIVFFQIIRKDFPVDNKSQKIIDTNDTE